MTIRPATPADARAIAEVHVSSWKTSYRGLVPDFALDDLDVDLCHLSWKQRFREMIPPKCCFVSEDAAGNITGFANAGPPQTTDLDVDGELYALYLLQSAQGQGIGRALFSQAVQFLIEAGGRSICLWFLKDNPARGFYERFGCRIVAEKPYVREGYTLPSLAAKWDDIHELARLLAPDRSATGPWDSDTFPTRSASLPGRGKRSGPTAAPD
jgi:ribosomal protein S18 acetylase RimI-like enzyme